MSLMPVEIKVKMMSIKCHLIFITSTNHCLTFKKMEKDTWSDEVTKN